MALSSAPTRATLSRLSGESDVYASILRTQCRPGSTWAKHAKYICQPHRSRKATASVPLRPAPGSSCRSARRHSAPAGRWSGRASGPCEAAEETGLSWFCWPTWAARTSRPTRPPAGNGPHLVYSARPNSFDWAASAAARRRFCAARPFLPGRRRSDRWPTRTPPTRSPAGCQ
jgi:hypothetical protein